MTDRFAQKNLTEGIVRAREAATDLRLAEQLETLLIRVAQLNEGAFSPLSQQPLVRALLEQRRLDGSHRERSTPGL